ncbi:MAG: potassium/proton antiporter, partial [Bacteroidetes bacterium]
MTIEYILFVGSALILISIAFTRFSSNLGVPALLLFLAIGMLAGSEGPGGIEFDDPSLAQSIGIVALVIILFAGGLDTKWTDVKPTVWHASSLATIGVFITAMTVGAFVASVLGVSLLSGILMGAIISSTDAAAVFSVLRSRRSGLPKKLKGLLELESGSNDPMAVFLTIGIIQIILNSSASIGGLILLFLIQMGLGALSGIIFGKGMVVFINRLKIDYEGVYPVASLAFAVLCYSATAAIGGSGFLAVYLAGLIAGNNDFVQKKSLLRFFDGLAWLSQIAMFLTLGLFVFPSHLVPVIGAGILVSLFLMFVARPLSVFISLVFSKFELREKAFISWVGLRGAVPIILATFPLIAKLPDAEMIFNLVFFIVLTSALFQAWSIPFSLRALKIDTTTETKREAPFHLPQIESVDTDLVDFFVPNNSAVIGQPIVEKIGRAH